jgi:hypothetical protein
VSGPFAQGPQPTRLRFDELTGLLFVADAELPVLHLFSVSGEGGLVSLGALPTGAPVRDFVLTAEVPDVTPEPSMLDEEAPSKRYLYALDERDGSLMAFALDASPEGASLTPILAPLAEQYADRLRSPGAAVALDVIDTRGLSPEPCGVGADGQLVAQGEDIEETLRGEFNDASRAARDADDELAEVRERLREPRQQLRELESELADARADLETALDNAPEPPTEESQAEIAELEAQIGELEGQVSTRQMELAPLEAEEDELVDSIDAREAAEQRYLIARDAGPRQLRGVFVVVVGLNGTVSVIDVLDLDLHCREAQSCEPNGELAGGSATPVGVRRHATRLSTVAQRNPLVSGPDTLEDIDCAGVLEGYVTLDGADTDLACVPADPWNQLDQTWSIEQERAIPGLAIQAAAIADESDGVPGFDALAEDQLILLAPAGLNLCERGLLANEGPPALGEGAESPGDEVVWDRIVIVSEPPEHLRGDCESPAAGSEISLFIDEAYADRVVVRPDPKSDLDDVTPEYLRRCYPDLLDFQVRTGEDPKGEMNAAQEYLVTGTATGYLHRVTTRVDGRCAIDPRLDERLRSRARAGELFVNPYVAFEINAEEPPTSLVIQVISGRSELRETVYDPGTTFVDALPVSVRFFPYTNDLFIVDSASQGLRRFALSPFTRTGQIFR